MLAGQALAILLVLAALIQTDLLSFVGLRQLLEGEKPGKLATGGLYRVVRHPLYTFTLLVLWLSPSMSVNSLVVYGVLTLYIFAGSRLEERKLLREFGAAYADYRSSTPMLFPGLKSLARGRAPARDSERDQR